MKASDTIRFRCSSLTAIMTGVAKNWSVDKSQTCKGKLIEIHREMMWNRTKTLSNKYIEKGLATEQDAISLYSRVKKHNYKKNSQRLTNEFITGEPDFGDSDDIKNAKVVIDTKSSYDPFTFPSLHHLPDTDYKPNMQGYMDLTGADVAIVAYCLVNTPAKLILDEKRKLRYKHEIIDIETPEYIEDCIELEKNSIFDMKLFLKHYPYFEFHCKDWKFDIANDQRVVEVVMVRDQPYINKMHDRTNEAREWMNINLFCDIPAPLEQQAMFNDPQPTTPMTAN